MFCIAAGAPRRQTLNHQRAPEKGFTQQFVHQQQLLARWDHCSSILVTPWLSMPKSNKVYRIILCILCINWLFIYGLHVWLPLNLSVCVCLAMCMSVCMPLCAFVLSVCPSARLPFHLSSVYLYVLLPALLSTCASVSLSPRMRRRSTCGWGSSSWSSTRGTSSTLATTFPPSAGWLPR